jgi:hypothetical protein
MSYSSVPEQVYDEFEAFIASHLPKVLSDYQLAQKDLPLPMFRQTLRGDYQLTDIKPEMFPTLIVKPGPVPINPSGEQRAVNKDLLNFAISLWGCSSANVNSLKITQLENLQRTCERYAWAFKEIIDGTKYIPTQVTLLNSIRRVTNIDWSAVEQGNNCKLQACFIDIELKLYINRV